MEKSLASKMSLFSCLNSAVSSIHVKGAIVNAKPLKLCIHLLSPTIPQSMSNSDSLVIGDSYSLASLQLLKMELGVTVLSNQEVELQASLKDMVLCDQQPDQQQKKTGSV